MCKLQNQGEEEEYWWMPASINILSAYLDLGVNSEGGELTSPNFIVQSCW